MKKPIYMDYHATTPVDPRVLQAMLPYFTEKFGNAASRNHSFGWEGEQAVEKARQQIAGLIGASPKEIIFTSGATESNNLAIKGVAEMYAEKGDHIITAVTEHKAVLDTCKNLQKHGRQVTFLRVGKDGLVDLDELRAAITARTILISIMHANNEIGVLQPIREIGRIAKERGVLFHTDATQAAGKVPIDVSEDNVDLLSISAHKMYGPKGIGALYVRRKNPRVQLTAQMDGGGHERGMRSGTLNVTGIVGLGEACAICREEMPAESERLRGLRDRLKTEARSRADRGLRQRLHGASPAEQPEHELRLRRGRIAPDGDQGRGRFQRLGLHLCNARAQLCAEGAGRGRRTGAHFHSLRARPLQHRGGSRLRGRAHHRDGRKAARAVPALRNGQRGRGSQVGPMAGGALRMSYSEKVLDHYNHPRNVGALDKRDPNVGTGMVGAPECGDVLRLQLKVNPETGVIEDAKFKTFGCGSAIASSSLATEWVKGRTVDQALEIKNVAIVNELSLPPVKIHCSVLAEDAIRAAIDDYRKKQAAGGNGNGAEETKT